MAEKPSEEYIKVSYTRPLEYRWKVGRFLSRYYQEIRDNKRLVANRCPKCNELFFPPHMVCGRCKVKASEELIVLDEGDLKGTVQELAPPRGQRFWDPRRGDWFEEPHPSATILLDSGHRIGHRLEETDMEKVKKGMRVQAVWKEKEERGNAMGDILYFRKIEE